MELNDYIKQIKAVDNEQMKICVDRWNAIAKPIGSLGKMEDIITKCGGILGSDIRAFKKCVVVMCADNGVVKEGVTQAPSSVTAIVANNMTEEKATIAIMSKHFGGDVCVVDIGMESDINNGNILNKKITYGTKSFLNDSAMTYHQAIKGIITGIEMVKMLKDRGYNLLATGEMGIGNTTTSSAVASVLLGKDPILMTGRGAGLCDEGLARKIEVIKEGIAYNKPNKNDPIDVLAKVGGYDIAGLCGVFLGGAIYGVPVLIDGFISSVAALMAIKLCDGVRDYVFATHISNEPAGKMLLEELKLPHIIDGNMRLGEGTGAVMCYPFFDVALKVYNNMSSFEEIEVEQYEVLKW